ncbi:MAG: DNA topoisomerase III, partial [Desulfobulbaceae bacterium A2]
MTEKSLIIAEKPSVAADIVKALPDKFTRHKTHYEGEQYLVSFAIGHLVGIAYPEEIDPRYQKWDISLLPILPENFPLTALSETKTQLSALGRLIGRKDVTEIVNACDAGREGELIFKYILRFVAKDQAGRKRIRRLWLQSMTRDAIRAGFAQLRDNSTMQSLEDTALCRSEADWLIGINATRALTGYNSRNGGFRKTSCGRVQTPTLSLIVTREHERLAFVPADYWELHASFTVSGGSRQAQPAAGRGGDGGQDYLGVWIDPAFKSSAQAPQGKANRIWDEARARDIVARCSGRPAAVSQSSRKGQQGPPPLYDLTSLQREANSRFGFSAKNTLSIAQALYERHKLLTYPRTDSRHLPEDYVGEARDIMGQQRGWQLGAFAAEALEKNYIKKNKRIFDNAKVSDHFAIIPTGVLPKTLSASEEKIYRMVVQRFIAAFFPAAQYLQTTRHSVVAGETFLTEGRIWLVSGWKAVYGAEADDEGEQRLAELAPDTAVLCREIETRQQTTKPPARYTEATLLSAMEHSDKLLDDEGLREAMKDRGLGTPATRAAIIEKLLSEKYLVREGKELAPTGKAFELIAL